MDTKIISQQAAEQFEKLTGVKPVQTKTYTAGSMKGYVRFVIPTAHGILFNQFYVEGNRTINGLGVEFLGVDHKKPFRSVVHIQRNKLGV